MGPAGAGVGEAVAISVDASERVPSGWDGDQVGCLNSGLVGVKMMLYVSSEPMVRAKKQIGGISKCGACECITKEEGGDVVDYFGGLDDGQSAQMWLPSNGASMGSTSGIAQCGMPSLVRCPHTETAVRTVSVQISSHQEPEHASADGDGVFYRLPR